MLDPLATTGVWLDIHTSALLLRRALPAASVGPHSPHASSSDTDPSLAH